MRNYIWVLLCFCAVACHYKLGNNRDTTNPKQAFEIVKSANYELVKTKDQTGLLVLFPGFGENFSEIKNEFNIEEAATRQGVSILYINFNQHLSLEDHEQIGLALLIDEIISVNKLNTENIYIGGFSSGGNVSLSLTNYLIRTKHSIKPRGVFIVDSPVDLLQLYYATKRNLELDFSEASIREAKWLLNLFNSDFGDPQNGIEKYEQYSPYTATTSNLNNVTFLDSLRIRFYTEPDTTWWRKNRQNNPEDLNAIYIEKLSVAIKQKLGNSKVEYIETKNRGYRANGERHPHSWAIVDEDDLMKWMLDK
ncbi:MAG: hypothetical protein GY816_06175 [Cytophagales bacterium]|nr:hypothetical protein [Cytophagales bacterium]